MTKATNGSTVRIHFTGKLEDGQVFDTTYERDPMEFTVGSGRTIDGLEEAVTGMAPGDKKVITLTPDKAFGQRDEEMVHTIARTHIPADVELQVGIPLQVQSPQGETYMVSVVALADDTVTLDGNHPLAGRTLIFEIEMMDVA